MRSAWLPGWLAVLFGLCACDRSTPPAPPVDITPSAVTSALVAPATATVRAGQAELTATVRNAAGEPLEGVAVELTVTPSSVATLEVSSARTDASGSARFNVALLWLGDVRLAAEVAGGALHLEATLHVTCGAQERPTPSSYPTDNFWRFSEASAAPARALADGASRVRVVASAHFAIYAASPMIAQPIEGACFAISVDRPDVRPLTPRGSAGPDGTFEFLLTSASPGPAVVTVETEYGTKQVAIEFAAKAGWARRGSDAGAPTDVMDVALSRSGALLAAADGRLWRSDDGGITWTIATGAAGDPTPFELDAARVVPSRTAPGVTFALSASGTLARSLDDGLTFALLDLAGVEGLAADPAADRFLAWRAGVLLDTVDHGTTWRTSEAPAPGSVTYWPAPNSRDVAVQLDASAFHDDAHPTYLPGSVTSYSALWTSAPWARSSTFPPLNGPPWWEYLSLRADGFTQDEADPAALFTSVSMSAKIGPGGYTDGRDCFRSSDAGATWFLLPACSPRGAIVQMHGASGLYAATDHQLLRLVGDAFREVDVGLPEGVRRLAFDAADPATVYAATSSGVYMTTTSGE